MGKRYCEVIYRELHFHLVELQLQDHYQLSQQVYVVEVVVMLLYAYLERAIAQTVQELQFGICQVCSTKQRSNSISILFQKKYCYEGLMGPYNNQQFSMNHALERSLYMVKTIRRHTSIRLKLNKIRRDLQVNYGSENHKHSKPLP